MTPKESIKVCHSLAVMWHYVSLRQVTNLKVLLPSTPEELRLSFS